VKSAYSGKISEKRKNTILLKSLMLRWLTRVFLKGKKDRRLRLE